jgi:hypothetical protein
MEKQRAEQKLKFIRCRKNIEHETKASPGHREKTRFHKSFKRATPNRDAKLWAVRDSSDP